MPTHLTACHFVFCHCLHRLIADKQIPTACVKFAQQKRAEILRKGISRNFMTHLIALCDFGLISPAVIRSSMNIVLGVS